MEPTTQDFNDLHAGRGVQLERPAARGEVRHEIIVSAEPDDAFSTHFVRTIDDHGAVIATDLSGVEGLACIIVGREVETVHEPLPNTYDLDDDPDVWDARAERRHQYMQDGDGMDAPEGFYR